MLWIGNSIMDEGSYPTFSDCSERLYAGPLVHESAGGPSGNGPGAALFAPSIFPINIS
jgi:hypothetical protein